MKFKLQDYVYVKGLPAEKKEVRDKQGIAKIVMVWATFYSLRFVGEEFAFHADEQHVRTLTPKEKKAVKFIEYLKPVHISPLAPK